MRKLNYSKNCIINKPQMVNAPEGLITYLPNVMGPGLDIRNRWKTAMPIGYKLERSVEAAGCKFG